MPLPRPEPAPLPGPVQEPAGAAESYPIWPFFRREHLRLDVDGRYPQMTASGTVFSGLAHRVHWIASLTADGVNTWHGPIWYKDGNTTYMPYTNVRITVARAW